MRQGLTEPLRVPIVRARIKLNPVESQLLDGGVGWISIKSFHANVEADLGEQLSYLRREAGGRLNGLVLDLRGNPGGYLNQAIAVSNRFLSDGVIVSTVDGQGREERARLRGVGTQKKTTQLRCYSTQVLRLHPKLLQVRCATMNARLSLVSEVLGRARS